MNPPAGFGAAPHVNWRADTPAEPFLGGDRVEKNFFDPATVPPKCNTGAQNASRTGLNACVDWLQVTFKNEQFANNPDMVIEEILLMDRKNFIEMDTGLYGYTKAKRFGKIAVFYGGREDMGIHLQMSGEGCREFERLGKMNWEVLFKVCLGAEGNFTRVDLAIDDYEGYWKMKTIERKVEKGEVVSKFRTAKCVKEYRLENGESLGETVYFGSSQSRLKLRMYDKRKQMHEKKGVDLKELPEVWNRTEIETRDERAQMVAHLIAEGDPVGRILRGVLKHYLRFAVRGKDKTKSRWKTAHFWDRFIKDVEPIRLTEKAEMEASVEKRIDWLYKQVAPTLAMVLKAQEGEMTEIYRIIRDGEKRLGPKEKVMIREYQQKTAAKGAAVTVVNNSITQGGNNNKRSCEIGR